MKIGVLIPDKNDRPLFLKHCLAMMRNQTVPPDYIHVQNGPSGIDGCDITWRYRKGMEVLFGKYACDVVFYIENDDWYSPTYIQTMLEMMAGTNADVFGLEKTIYYHIYKQEWKAMVHPGRSSAFCTVVTPAVMDIVFPKDNEPFFDLHLWKQNDLLECVTGDIYEYPICMGMKHGQGLCGGNGHKEKFPYDNKDQELGFLEKVMHADKHSIDFYKTLMAEKR